MARKIAKAPVEWVDGKIVLRAPAFSDNEKSVQLDEEVKETSWLIFHNHHSRQLNA